MASIVRNKVGKYTYLYESVSYRDSNGKPQTRKISIGKIDPQTGEPIYKPEYLERVRGTDKEPVINNVKQYSKDDIKRSIIRELGVFYLLESISREIGLVDVLKSSLNENWEQVLTLAFYMVATGEPAMYCEDWILTSESLPCGNMSLQNISELLSTITNEQRLAFYSRWGNLRSEHEYVALDITSISSYSELIGDVEWGYNRDKEKLPQVNVCMLFGEKSGLPIFQTTYSGSINDVSTLKSTLQLASGLKLDNMSIVMDKGFSRKDNIDAMLSDEDGIRFLIPTPLTMNFTKERILGEKLTIDTVDHTIVIGNDVVRGVTKKCAWNDEHDVYTHIVFNAELAYHLKNKQYGDIAKLKQEAINDPTNPKLANDFKKYLSIRKSKKEVLGYSVNIKHQVLEEELRYKGSLVLISNHVDNVQTALEIYRAKDVVEKGFLKLKNCLDLGRLRVHSDHRMQNKLFVGFIALIIMAHVHNVMSSNNMYEKFSMKKLIKSLERLRVQYINGERILFPLTKEHKFIFKAFGISEPV
jgi:transposase